MTIHSGVGQRYAPEDIGSVLAYREALDGQILEEGISEAGALASWTAAATSYSVHGLAMLPFYNQLWCELARDGQACEQRALAGEATPGVPWLTQQLAATHGPVIAATDYVRAVPDSVRALVPAGRRYVTLGTDGFGRSDTRAALRDYFGVDAKAIANAAVQLS